MCEPQQLNPMRMSYTQNPSYNAAVSQNTDHAPNDTTTPVYLNNNAFNSVVCDTAKTESLNHAKSDLKSLNGRHCSWVSVRVGLVMVAWCCGMCQHGYGCVEHCKDTQYRK